MAEVDGLPALRARYSEAKAAGMDLHSFWAHNAKQVEDVMTDPSSRGEMLDLVVAAVEDAPDVLELREALLSLYASARRAHEPAAYALAARSACTVMPSVSAFWLHLLRATECCGLHGVTPENGASRAAALSHLLPIPQGTTAVDAVGMVVAHVGGEALQQVFPAATSYLDIAASVLQTLLRCSRAGGAPSRHAAWVAHGFTFLTTYYPTWGDGYARLLDLWLSAVGSGCVLPDGLLACAASLLDLCLAGRGGGSGHGSQHTAAGWPLLAVVQAAGVVMKASTAARDPTLGRKAALATLTALCASSPSDVTTTVAMGQSLLSLVGLVDRAWLDMEAVVGCPDSTASAWHALESARWTAKHVSAAAGGGGGGGGGEEGGKVKKRKRARMEMAAAHPGSAAAAHSPSAPDRLHHGGSSDAMDDEGAPQPEGKPRRAVTGLAGLLGGAGGHAGRNPAPTQLKGKSGAGEARGTDDMEVAGEGGGAPSPSPSPALAPGPASAHHPRAVYVQGLPFKTVTPGPVKAAFSAFGVVVDVRLALTREGRGKGWAVVTFDADDGPGRAIAAGDAVSVDGRTVRTLPCRREIVDKWIAEEEREKSAGEAASRRPVTLFLPHGVKRAPKPRLDL